METIGDLLSRNLSRRIEEVIQVHQADEHAVHAEIAEYVATDSIRDQYARLFKDIAEAPAEPHESIGVWVSGFFGSGKSSFAKNLGYAMKNPRVLGEDFAALFKRQVDDSRVSDVLDLINSEELKAIWSEDETIGWVYQYFTPKELRDQARKESQAPRNSYELAFRNQFFTPRYVVEFLTDNTLGRIWYEMRKGETRLKDECRYMVRRPTEVFLAEGEEPSGETAGGDEDLSQAELLKRPVSIPHRPKKDRREIKVLDPACGSGHFLLYAFGLLLVIYEEAYDDPELGRALQADYPTKDDLQREFPGLILRHNLHGIDIDLRCTQIAALALWLRCQRAYQTLGLKKDRPPILKANVVCAEPMPGESAMLAEFVAKVEPRVLGQLVEVVFEKMKLAGEAGSLLKIEEEIGGAVAAAKREWSAAPASVQRTLFADIGPAARQQRFEFSDLTDDQFFDRAEEMIVESLGSYAGLAHNGQALHRRLFADDAARGLGFVDVCRHEYDVVLMNPPFDGSSKPGRGVLEKQYPRTKNDLYAAFVEMGLRRLQPGGLLGRDHVADRLLPHVVPEVARGDPAPRGPADRVCRPGLRRARHGHGRDGGLLSGQMPGERWAMKDRRGG